MNREFKFLIISRNITLILLTAANVDFKKQVFIHRRAHFTTHLEKLRAVLNS